MRSRVNHVKTLFMYPNPSFIGIKCRKCKFDVMYAYLENTIYKGNKTYRYYICRPCNTNKVRNKRYRSKKKKNALIN